MQIGGGKAGSLQNAAAEGAVGAAAPATVSGSFTKDTTESSTAPKFGEVLEKLNTQFGAKAEKPREIKKQLGKDDFLKIMIMQMKNQDPTNPFKPEQMAAEMAQFSSVEQLQNINAGMQKMTGKDQPMERLAMSGLIGKTVTVSRDRFQHTEGSNESLGFNLSKPATSVKISVVSADTGEPIFEKDLGAMKKGEGTLSWDGKKSNTLPAKTGNYIVRVEAKDERGAEIPMDTQHKARVVGVSFEGSEPVFLVGDAKHQDKIPMKSVIRIDDIGGASSLSGAPEATEAADAPKSPNLFSFEKGKGSQELDPSALGAGARAAMQKLAQADSAPAAAPAQPKSQNSAEKGFPNGLQN